MGYETKSPLLDEAALFPIALRESGYCTQLLDIDRESGQTCDGVDIAQASGARSIHASPFHLLPTSGIRPPVPGISPAASPFRLGNKAIEIL